MRVWRVLRVLIPVLIVAVLVAGVVAVFVARPDIESAKDDVDAQWAKLAPALTVRYDALAQADEPLKAIPGSIRTVANDVDTALQRWRQVEDGGAIDAQVRAANSVEAASRRMLVVVTDSPRVKGNNAVQQPLLVFIGTPAPDPTAFNASVATYQAERRGPVRQIIADLVGGGDIPGLATPPSPSETA
jgi:hypothetical protein